MCCVLQAGAYRSGFHCMLVTAADGKIVSAFREIGAPVHSVEHTRWWCNTVPPLYWRNVHAVDATNNVCRVKLRSAPMQHTHKPYVAL